jgi:hypothetical protein
LSAAKFTSQIKKIALPVPKASNSLFALKGLNYTTKKFASPSPASGTSSSGGVIARLQQVNKRRVVQIMRGQYVQTETRSPPSPHTHIRIVLTPTQSGALVTRANRAYGRMCYPLSFE